MTHIMVDCETTGTDPQTAGILQLAAVKFNLSTLKVGTVFDRCPAMLPRRSWADSTRAFWRGHKHILDTLIDRQEPARPVFEAFGQFCSEGAPFGGYTFVAKPLKFDWPMVESHMIDLDVVFPFAHHNYLDLHSYVAGLRGAVCRTDIESEVPFPAAGKQHDALHDCAYQIDLLFHAKRNHIAAEVVE